MNHNYFIKFLLKRFIKMCRQRETQSKRGWKQSLLWHRKVLVRFRKLSRSSTTQMTSVDEFTVIDHPERTKVILISHKTLMEGQVGAYCILCREKLGGRQKREGHSEVWENANINAGHRNKAANRKRRKW